MKCKCYKLEKEINLLYPNTSWDMSNACAMWHEESLKLEDKNIVFERDSDAAYSCTCPTCGRVVCKWCL